jgi:Spy/CpxP family protein refolding chaperone
MKRNLLILALIVLVIVNISALATIIHGRWSRDARPRLGRPSVHPVVFFREHLGLDESQIAEFQERRSSFEDQISDVRSKMHEKRTDLMKELRSESPDTVRVYELVDEIGTLQAQLQKHAVRHMLHEQLILTPEQREKFLMMFDEHLWGKGMMPRPGHGRRPGPRFRPLEKGERHRQGGREGREETIEQTGGATTDEPEGN